MLFGPIGASRCRASPPPALVDTSPARTGPVAPEPRRPGHPDPTKGAHPGQTQDTPDLREAPSRAREEAKEGAEAARPHLAQRREAGCQAEGDRSRSLGQEARGVSAAGLVRRLRVASWLPGASRAPDRTRPPSLQPMPEGGRSSLQRGITEFVLGSLATDSAPPASFVSDSFRKSRIDPQPRELPPRVLPTLGSRRPDSPIYSRKEPNA